MLALFGAVPLRYHMLIAYPPPALPGMVIAGE
jgi:hypothetical protein